MQGVGAPGCHGDLGIQTGQPTSIIFVRAPNAEGIVQPTFCTYRYFKAVMTPIQEGMQPVKELVSICSPCSFVSNERLDGICGKGGHDDTVSAGEEGQGRSSE